MARKALKVKQQRTPKYKTRSVLRKYGICRVCFRELASRGEIPGVKKASW